MSIRESVSREASARRSRDVRVCTEDSEQKEVDRGDAFLFNTKDKKINSTLQPAIS